VNAATENSDAGASRLSRRAVRWGLAVLLVLVLAARVAAVFTANANWDEFALLHLVDQTEVTGVLHSGGRPGLAVVMLLPFVADCDDEIEVLRRARLLWLAITLAFLVGLAAWLAQLSDDPRARVREAALGVALLALVPAFLEWSLQVRTDQIALAGGAWGGAVLLASQRRPRLALVAGACFAVGFLGSQKLIYVGALAGLLALGRLWLARDLRPGREALRLALCAAGFLAVAAAFRLWVDAAFEVPGGHASRQPVTRSYVERGLSLFDFYRNTIGTSQYRAILPTLAPHLLLLVGLVAASWVALRRRARHAGRLALAWCVLLLGTGVAVFHAGAFGYFWMTLGLFPAVAFALALEPIRALPVALGAPVRRGLVAAWCCLLAFPAALETGLLLKDTQAVQRESLAFVHRNFARDDVGFHPESALFCQAGVQPIRTHFSHRIYQRFGGPDRARHSARMMRTFRERPVKFIVQSFRLNQFPAELRGFWAANYQPYRAAVFVAGRHLAGARGADDAFEVLVPGRYRWLPSTGPQPLAIDGTLLAAGASVDLDRGDYLAHFVEDVPGGMLVLAVDEPPGAAPQEFYH
jgi:hypothetical protein